MKLRHLLYRFFGLPKVDGLLKRQSVHGLIGLVAYCETRASDGSSHGYDASNVGTEAVRALGRIPGDLAFLTLVQILKKKHSRFQADAADALGDRGDHRAIPYFIEVLARRSGSGRTGFDEAIYRALQRLTGESFYEGKRTMCDQWLEWFRASGTKDVPNIVKVQNEINLVKGRLRIWQETQDDISRLFPKPRKVKEAGQIIGHSTTQDDKDVWIDTREANQIVGEWRKAILPEYTAKLAAAKSRLEHEWGMTVGELEQRQQALGQELWKLQRGKR